MYNVQTRDKNFHNITGNFRRFHDQYRSYLVKAEIGFTNKNFADDLLLGLEYGNVHSEIQTGANGSRNLNGSFDLPAVGEAFTEENNLNYTLKYRNGFLDSDRLYLTFFATYNSLGSTSVDTSRHQYSFELITDLVILQLAGYPVELRLCI